jgi:glycosyltransferase involved in cell wall biosynthesis
MYLITINVPIYLRGSERLLATQWRRSLLLLRDSLGGRYGRLRIVAPSIDVASDTSDQLLEPVSSSDELELFPSFPLKTRARAFWTQYVHTWRRELAQHVPHADVVHSGFCDVFRPISFMGFLFAHHARKPTVFVQDTDLVLQISELTRGADLRKRLRAKMYCAAYERSVRHGVARASLGLLKGEALIARYGPYAKNAKNFHDTSFLSDEVILEAQLERRIHALLHETKHLRLAYCGRLDARKGVANSIEAIALARSKGVLLSFDIIGDGAERARLEHHVAKLGLQDTVRFLGSRVYGPELLHDLGGYDAMLFTPNAEDTPRMIFDGYAAGLPLLAYAIGYVLEREREDRAVISVPHNADAMAALLGVLDRDRPRLADLARRARQAALYHSADNWYRRRAMWTDEAVAQHRLALRN